MTYRSRRQTSRASGESSTASSSRRSSTSAAIRSAGEHHVERSAIERMWAIASATGWPAMSSGGSRQIDHEPPADRHSKSSTSLQPYKPVRSAATSASSSVGVGGGAQRQHHVADVGGGIDDRAVLGPVRDLAFGERRLERRQRGAGREQDGDVARTALTALAGALVGRPAIVRGAPWRRRRRRRPASRQRKSSAFARCSPRSACSSTPSTRTEPCSRWCGRQASSA